MKHWLAFFLLILTAVVLLVTWPCSCQEFKQMHPRGSVRYPKTMKMWSDRLNKLIDVNMDFNRDAKAYDPDEEIKYFIHKKDQQLPILIALKTVESDNEHIDSNGMWYFGVHGFQGNHSHSPIIPELVAEIQGNISANIIQVDWEDGAAAPSYGNAVNNTKLVGKSVAKVIRRLVEKGLAKKDLIHLIGFSLGGQAVGIIGQSLFATAGWKPWRITGLDPARPMFEGEPPDETIDPQDGEYVEIFHTSGGKLGVWNPHGHVDIYVNKGHSPQPGCELEYFHTCSHQFAKKVFGNYTHLQMKAFRCTSFEDFKNGNCNHDCKTPCTIGFTGKNCKDGVYHLDTTKYFD